MELIQKASEMLVDHGDQVATAIGFMLVVVAKVKSTEKARGMIAGVQKLLDVAAKGMLMLGGICQAASQILAQALKSDGLLGRK